MISFRYHVFTVVAIFLAVALGIAVGNAYVQPALVSRLERETQRQAAAANEWHGRFDRLAQATDVLPILVDGDLAGHRVIVVTHVGVDVASLGQVRRALDAAGAELTAALAVTDVMSADRPQDRETLADVLTTSPTDDPAPLVERAVEVVADRLVQGPARRDTQPGTEDVLGALLRAEFLTIPSGSPDLSEADLEDLGGNDELIVVVAGGDEEPVPSTDRFLAPLVGGLLARGATVAAAESNDTAYPFVPALRADDAVDGRIVTVDDVDLPVGGTALVLGLERLLVLGQGGDYGYKGSPPDVTALPPP